MSDLTPFVRPDCKDCGRTDGMGWWIGSIKHPGSAGPRCRPCYLAYCRARASYVHFPRTKSAPTPYVPAAPVPCALCGVMFKRKNQSLTCSACAASRRRVSEQRRRERERLGDTSIHWSVLGERDGWRCHVCRKGVPQVAGTAERMDGATVDHLVPIVDGGSHTWDNVALSHRSCNLERGTGGLAQLRLVG